MKKLIMAVMALARVRALAGGVIFCALALSAEPVKVVFDTDMLTDFDDVGALACLHALADAGECEILATVSCTRGNASVAAVEVINGYYGRGDLPVGAPKGDCVLGGIAGAKQKVDPKSPLDAEEGTPRHAEARHLKYRKLAADYPQWVRHLDADDAPDAKDVYRRVLSAAPDGSVVVCTVGFLTNLRNLLDSKPDAISPLDGKALVARKVKKLVSMACAYPSGKEYNSMSDWKASKAVFENWPTPVVFSDWTYGCDVFAGRAVAEMKGPRNPVKDVFAGNIPSREEIASDPAHWLRCNFGVGGRSAWDETAVLVAVRGENSLFNVHRGTYRMVGSDGADEWAPDEENGQHLRITEKTSKAEVGCIIDELICRGPRPAAERTISADEFRDRMTGAWLGQSVGVAYGCPTEFGYNGTIIPADKMPVWKPELVNETFSQDDLYVEMTFIGTMLRRGVGVSCREAGIDFANSAYRLWCANVNARNNLRNGIAAPASSHPKFHPTTDDIDYQIEADFSGILAPGLPQAAVDLGETFGRIMNYGDGLYAGQFIGALYAEAYFETDRVRLVEKALKAIPSESTYAGMVRDMLAWHAAEPKDWQVTWTNAVEKYFRAKENLGRVSYAQINVKINGAMVLLGLLYGDGDMDRTMYISTAGGFDSDCNPSSACGVLGTMIGFRKLGPRYFSKLDRTKKWEFTDFTWDELIAASDRLVRQIVVRYGGRIEKDAAGAERFVLPVAAVRPSAFFDSARPGPVPSDDRLTDAERDEIRYLPCDSGAQSVRK